jgi:hypothetical protein
MAPAPTAFGLPPVLTLRRLAEKGRIDLPSLDRFLFKMATQQGGSPRRCLKPQISQTQSRPPVAHPRLDGAQTSNASGADPAEDAEPSHLDVHGGEVRPVWRKRLSRPRLSTRVRRWPDGDKRRTFQPRSVGYEFRWRRPLPGLDPLRSGLSAAATDLAREAPR